MLLRMRDFVTFLDLKATENKKRLFECQDSKEESGHKLLVTVAATHSGIVNGNMRFYRPDKMISSLHTWTPKGKLPIPNILHHDKHGECVGRVMTARYVDLCSELLPQNSDFRNNFFCDARGGGNKLGLYDSIDWIVENFQNKVDDYVGLGYTELGLKVTNPSAIRKILDGEFMGVSVGFGTDSGVCSVCHTDWAKDSQCEHKIGKRYGNSRKLAYLVTGSHLNKEISWVNFPADTAARVLNTKSLSEISDSLEAKFFWMGLPMRRQNQVLEDAELLEVGDSLGFLDHDIELVTEAEMDRTKIDELIEQSKGQVVKDSALELRATMGGLNLDELDADGKRRIKRALVNLDSVIRKNGWNDAMTKESVEARIAAVPDVLPTLADNAARTEYLTKLETDAKVFGLEFVAPKLEDKAEPQTPAAPPTEGADSQKGIADPAPAGTEPVLSDAVKEATAGLTFKDSEIGKSFVEALVALEKVAITIPEDERWVAQDALYTLWEKINKTNSLEWAKQRLSKEDAKDMIVSKDEWSQIHDELTTLDADIKKLETDNTVLQKANTTLLTDQKHSLATQLVLGRLFAGDAALKGLDAAGLQAQISEKAGRSVVSLNDAIADLMDSLPSAVKNLTRNEPAAAPAAAAAETSPVAETAKEITDSTSIEVKEEPGSTLTDSVEADGTKNRPFNLPIPRADLLRRMARARHQQLNPSKTE